MAKGEEDHNERQLALIRYSRSIDQDTTRTIHEKIDNLGLLLSAAKASSFYAAEEISLRWLLKQMDGSTDAAEQVRRYPSTWTIISCLFDRIPLFSLSRIFIERRFLSVLQQTAKDLAKPHEQQPGPEAVVNGAKADKSKKRKREEDDAINLDKLRTPEQCVKAAAELFGALAKLFSLLDAAPGQLTEEVTIGAEHVKLLFRVPAEEARELVAHLLAICHQVPDILRGNLSSEYQNWIQVSTSVWDLHAASKEDVFEFGTRLFPVCCSLISKIEGLGLDDQRKPIHPVGHKWVWETSRFAIKNLVNPARATFSNSKDGSLSVLTVARANNAICAEVLWNLAVSIPHSGDSLAKKDFALWTRAVFTFLLEALEEANAANKDIISRMLDAAILTKSSVANATTHRICTEYALKDGTDWALLAKTVQCESELFVTDGELLATVLSRAKAVSRRDGPDSDIVATGILAPLMRAFSRLRDLSGFVHTWYAQLAQLENESKDALAKSVWADSGLRDEFAKIMQSSLSTTQVLKLIDWLSSQEGGPGSLLIISDALTESIGPGAHDYTREVGSKLVDLISKKPVGRDFSEDIRCLKSRIIGRTITWLPPDEVQQIWTDNNTEIKKTLKKGSLATPDTYEVFKCSCEFCLHIDPDGPDGAKVMKAACSFVARLSTEIGNHNDLSAFPYFLDYAEIALSSFAELGRSPQYMSKGFQSDLFQLLLALRRFLRAGVPEAPRIMSILQTITRVGGCFALDLFLDEIVRDLFEPNDNACPWTKEESKSDLSLLFMFNLECLSKERRRCIMLSWLKWRTQIADHFSSSPEYAELVMGVLVNVSKQPTFYNEMKFGDIVDFALRLSSQPAHVLVLLGGLVEFTVGHIVDIAGPTAAAYIAGISAYAQDLDVSETDDRRVHLVLLQSAMLALRLKHQGKSTMVLDTSTLVQKQRSIIEQSLTRFASDWKKKKDDKGDQVALTELDLTLEASEVIKEEIATQPIELSSKTLKRLTEASQKLCASGNSTGWKLKTFLTWNHNASEDIEEFVKEQNLADADLGDDEEAISAFVDASTNGFDIAKKLDLLQRLTSDHEIWKGSSTVCLIVRRIVDTIPSSEKSIPSDSSSFDLATVHNSLALLLTKTTSPKQFENIVKAMVDLLEKHAAAMSQSNIDFTLSSITKICSSEGPQLEKGPHVAGEVFAHLYDLVAAIIRRHRTRLRGHHHLLVTILQALLRVLLADPALRSSSSSSSSSSRRSSATTSFLYPPWLDEPLRPHHAAQLTRLLTLLCEPSHAALAAGATRKHKSALDSAKDTARREVGPHLFRVVLAYIQLQLEKGDVPRDVRRTLEPGMFAVLAVTGDGGRRILNESLDASGRVIFRRMFAEFTKSVKRND